MAFPSRMATRYSIQRRKLGSAGLGLISAYISLLREFFALANADPRRGVGARNLPGALSPRMPHYMPALRAK